jgi:hypothetical protein
MWRAAAIRVADFLILASRAEEDLRFKCRAELWMRSAPNEVHRLSALGAGRPVISPETPGRRLSIRHTPTISARYYMAADHHLGMS